MSEAKLLLGIDTCGPVGSVALARLSWHSAEILGETELAGRSYSAQLAPAVRDLLAAAGLRLADLAAIVVTDGPGSFTGVRVGLATAKGLAEGARLPLIAVSRLEALALKAGVASAAIDAHRNEVFLLLGDVLGAGHELLAGSAELVAEKEKKNKKIAVCEDAAEKLLAAAWPEAVRIRVAAPTAADALRLALPRFEAARFDDIVALDGHYIRRSDAEIFGSVNPALLPTMPEIVRQ